MRLLGLLAGDTRAYRLAEAFNFLAKSLKREFYYQEFAVSPEFFKEAFWGLRALSAGFNLGAPYRRAALQFLDWLSEDARVVGSADTVEVNGELRGHALLCAAFGDLLGELGSPRVALVLGAGATGLSVALACLRRGLRVHLASRSPSRARPFELVFENLRVWPLDPKSLAEPLGEAELVVNATPLGSVRYPHAKVPLRYDLLKPGSVAVDLVQRPLETPFLEAASRFAGRCLTGFATLRHFAARAWALWTGDRRERALGALDKSPLVKYIYYPFGSETPGGSDHEAEAAQGQDNSRAD